MTPPAALDRRLKKHRDALGAQLAELREEAGYTQAQPGELVGVRRNTVASWEAGATSPSADKLVELAILYDADANGGGTWELFWAAA